MLSAWHSWSPAGSGPGMQIWLPSPVTLQMLMWLAGAEGDMRESKTNVR